MKTNCSIFEKNCNERKIDFQAINAYIFGLLVADIDADIIITPKTLRKTQNERKANRNKA